MQAICFLLITTSLFYCVAFTKDNPDSAIDEMGMQIDKYQDAEIFGDPVTIPGPDCGAQSVFQGENQIVDLPTEGPLFEHEANLPLQDYSDDIYWDNNPSFAIAGMDRQANASVVFNGQLIVGGRFQVSGTKVVHNIAAWDGDKWIPLGPGVDGEVWALCVYQGKLVVGGLFEHAGGLEAKHIAEWDGSAWSTLGAGVDGDALYEVAVRDLFEYEEKLVVGGAFTSAGEIEANFIAVWDGESWSNFGSGMNDEVWSLAEYNGQLIAGGIFTEAGGEPAAKIAAWNGTGWNSMNSNIDVMFRQLGVYSLYSYNGKLLVGGQFYILNVPYMFNIIAWDGTNWMPFGEGFHGIPYDFAEYQGKLIAAGYFLTGGTNSNIEYWDDSGWVDLGGGANESVHSVTLFDSELIAVGRFQKAGGVPANYVAAFNGASWRVLGNGMPGIGSFYSTISCFTIYKGKLIAAADFADAEGNSTNNLVAWDGTTWSSLGAGVNGPVRDLSIYDDKLIVGGRFTKAGNLSAKNIASWDGQNWEALGSGVGSWVRSLTTYDGKLMVGTSGEWQEDYIFSWDGSVWSHLGNGLDRTVHSLATHNGELIAGGLFTQSGTLSTPHIAAWNGTEWHSLGGGLSYIVTSMTEYHGNLIAGGYFDSASAIEAHKIAAWDGNSWSPVGPGMNNNVFDLIVYNGQLYAGGNFTFTSDSSVSVNNIARWNGNQWLPLGSGINGSDYSGVSALAEYDDHLYVGGSFSIVNEKVSPYIARWSKTWQCGDVDGDNSINIGDVVYLAKFMIMQGPAPEPMESADVNCDGKCNLGDIVSLLNFIFRNGSAPCDACD